MPTFLTTPQSISLAGVSLSTWTTLNSGAPAGTTGVILNFGSATINPLVTTRMTNGSPDTQTSNTGIGGGCQVYQITGVNSSGQFDVFATGTSGLTCWLVGYFGSEAVFFANAQVLSPTLTASYQNFNCSSFAPGGLAVLLDCFGAGAQFFFRQNGSTDTTINYGAGSQSFIVGLDTSQIFQARNNNVGGTMYVKGYMQAGVVWHTNALNIGGAFTAGSFQNVAQGAGDPPAAGILGYSYMTQAGSGYTLCGSGCNTSTFNPQQKSNNSGFGSAVFAGPTPAQVNPVSATQVMYETSFFTPTQIPQSPWQLYGLKNMVAQ